MGAARRLVTFLAFAKTTERCSEGEPESQVTPELKVAERRLPPDSRPAFMGHCCAARLDWATAQLDLARHTIAAWVAVIRTVFFMPFLDMLHQVKVQRTFVR